MFPWGEQHQFRNTLLWAFYLDAIHLERILISVPINPLAKEDMVECRYSGLAIPAGDKNGGIH